MQVCKKLLAMKIGSAPPAISPRQPVETSVPSEFRNELYSAPMGDEVINGFLAGLCRMQLGGAGPRASMTVASFGFRRIPSHPALSAMVNGARPRAAGKKKRPTREGVTARTIWPVWTPDPPASPVPDRPRAPFSVRHCTAEYQLFFSISLSGRAFSTPIREGTWTGQERCLLQTEGFSVVSLQFSVTVVPVSKTGRQKRAVRLALV